MQLKFPQFLVALLIVGALVLGGCSTVKDSSQAFSPSARATSTTTEPSRTTTTEPNSVTPTTSESIPVMNNLPRLEGQATVVMMVNGAPITIDVDGTNAPITAGNFVDLVNKGVYNDTFFHRVERAPMPFVVQGGDPQSKNPNFPQDKLGTGSYIDPTTKTVRYIPLEIKPNNQDKLIYSKTFEMAGVKVAPQLPHKQGAVAMARSPQPDSASCQFYIALANLAFLDGNYAVFGYVTEGFDVVNNIKQGDRIDSAKVTKGLQNLKIAQ